MTDNAHVASFPQWSSVRSTTVDFVREFFDVTGDNALPCTPTEHDVRIEREQWVYYVRAVHRGQLLKQDLAPIDFLSLAFYVVFSGFVDEWRAGRPWKVAVLRRRAHGMWRLQLLHKEILKPGEEPDVRRLELVAAVTSGKFVAA